LITIKLQGIYDTYDVQNFSYEREVLMNNPKQDKFQINDRYTNLISKKISLSISVYIILCREE